MKILVVGSLPPPANARAEALQTEVVGLLADGHIVEVVAPSAVATAHQYMTATGLAGCLRLATMVSGFDSVVVQLQPGLPVRLRARGWERRLSLIAFAFALGRGHRVQLRLQSPDDLPGGPDGAAARRVWAKAERIVVGYEGLRAGLISSIGAQAEHVVVCSSPPSQVAVDDGRWGEDADVSAEDVLELVRKRAARERRELGEDASAHFAGWDRLATPGSAEAEWDLSIPRTRKPIDLARSALAAADRRPWFRPAATAARIGYRSAKTLFRDDPPE